MLKRPLKGAPIVFSRLSSLLLKAPRMDMNSGEIGSVKSEVEPLSFAKSGNFKTI